MKLFVFLVSLLSLNLSAGIYYKTGDFYLMFTDIDLANGLKVDRAYNSLGNGEGIFGKRWGSHLETKLYNVAGVMLYVEEIPGGGRHHYLLDSKDDFNELIDEIIKIKEKRDGRIAKDKKADFISRLKGSPYMLGEFAKTYNIPGKMKVGAIYRGIDKGGETIKIISGGTYVRYKADGSKDQFNAKGLRIKEKTVGGIVRTYIYNKDDKIAMIKDSRGRWLKMYYANNRIVKIVSYSGKTAEYKYNKKGQLVYMKDAKGNKFKHSYDDQDRMLKAYIPTNQPGLSGWWEMKYDKDGRLIYQKDPGAWQTYIKYASTETEKEKRNYIEVTKKQGKSTVYQEKYSYVERLNKKGAFYTYKVTYVNNKNYKREVKYNECCPKPLMINNNGKVTVYKYNSNANVIKKILPNGTVYTASYKGNLPVSVTNNGLKYFIKYDSKNRIKHIGTKYLNFKLGYDNLNRVNKIVDNKGRSLKYIFAQGKKLKAIITKYGNLNITYNKKGAPVYKASNNKVKQHIKEIFSLQDDYLDTVLILNQLN